MTALHHGAVLVRDVDESLRFYRDGIGLNVLMDHEFEGAWRSLFDAPSDRLRSIFLGDAAHPDAGIVELVQFDGAVPRGAWTPPATGFFLLSFLVDVDEVLARLDDLGMGGEPRRIEVPAPTGSVAMATVRDPDGLLVELVATAPH
jgi:catechol 2,3-dioxygenase-like lactoylglutathione lyase family enzyme